MQLKLSDGTQLDLTIGVQSKRIELLTVPGNSPSKVLLSLSRADLKALGDEFLSSYERTKWNEEQGHLK